MENKLERVLETVADKFDIALLDLPISLGLLTVNGLVAAQEVLIPARPEFIDLRALALLVETLNNLLQGLNSVLMNPDLVVAGILPTFYNLKLQHHGEIIAAWQATGMPLLDARVMYSHQHVADIIIQGLGTADWELELEDKQ